MAEHWITRDEAVKRLGQPEDKFRAAFKLGLFSYSGRGSGQRFDVRTVDAVALIWNALVKLLPQLQDKQPGRKPVSRES